MSCHDQSLTYLKSFNYNVVRLPRADIRPLQILVKKSSSLEALGDISSLMITGSHKPLPDIKENVKTASISGKRTNDLSLDVGLTILGNIIGAMGGGSLGLKAQYNNARTLAFEFQDVLSDSIELIKLDQFLTDAGTDPFSNHLKKLLESDKVYIITSTIKSKTVNVEANKTDKTSLEVDATAIKEILGPSVKLGSNAEKSTKMSYTGTEDLVFGFKAVKLVYEEGKYVAFETIDDGGFSTGAVKAIVPQKKQLKYLQAGNELIDLDVK